MALIGASAVSKYGFYIPVAILRLYELHLIIEPYHPIINEELLIFLPTDCISVNFYIHGKLGKSYGTFLHTLLEKIYEQPTKNGIFNLTETLCILTDTNNYGSYESKEFNSLTKLVPEDKDPRKFKVNIDGIEVDVYRDLEIQVVDFIDAIKLEFRRKNGNFFSSGVFAIRFSIITNNPTKKTETTYKIHIFSTEVLGEDITLVEDEKLAIQNSFILNYIDKTYGLKNIQNLLNRCVSDIKACFKNSNERDIFEQVYLVNELFSKFKKFIVNYFNELGQEHLEAHSDIWLQIPEFIAKTEHIGNAEKEDYSWNFVFSVKPVRKLISQYHIDKLSGYHLYLAKSRISNKLIVSPSSGGITEEFQLRFRLEPSLLMTILFPIYIIVSNVFKFFGSLVDPFLQGFTPYEKFRENIKNFDKLQSVRYLLFIKEIYKETLGFQNIVTIALLFITLMFTLSSIIAGTILIRTQSSSLLNITFNKISISEYILLTFKLLKSPIFFTPLILSCAGLMFLYLYSSYKKVKSKWE